MTSKAPDMPGKIPKMPKCNPPKSPGRDKSKDNEIKMQMAKDLMCSLFISPKSIEEVSDNQAAESCCDLAEQIFNRFNK